MRLWPGEERWTARIEWVFELTIDYWRKINGKWGVKMGSRVQVVRKPDVRRIQTVGRRGNMKRRRKQRGMMM